MFAYRLIGFFLRKPVTVLMLLIALFILGIIALDKIPVQQLPSGLEVPVIFCRISYMRQDTGISPLEVERSLARPIEEELSTLSGIDKLHSDSYSGSVRFLLFFKQSANMSVMYAEVKDRIDRVRAKLKEPINPPSLFMWNPNDQSVVDCGILWDPKVVSSPFYFIEDVILQRLNNVPGVAKAEISGFVQKSLYIEFISSKVDKHLLNPWLINQKLREDNFLTELGRIKSYDEQLLTVADMTFQSI